MQKTIGTTLFRALFILLILLLTACNRNQYEFQGYIEGEYTYLASPIAGSLTQLLVERGNQVTTNQPLFILDPQPELAKLQQAKNELDQANQQLLNQQEGQRATVIAGINAQLAQSKASLEYAKKTFERYQTLYKQHAIDKATFDQVKANYEQNSQKLNELSANLAEAKLGAREHLLAAQQAAVAAATAAVTQAEWALLQKSIRAPVVAQVFDTLYQPGEFVTAGQPVVILLPPNKIKLIFFVTEDVVNKIKIDSSVMVNCDNCKQKYGAKINFISPNAEYTPPVIFSKDSRDKLVYRVEAKFNVDDAVQFHPGQPVDVVMMR